MQCGINLGDLAITCQETMDGHIVTVKRQNPDGSQDVQEKTGLKEVEACRIIGGFLYDTEAELPEIAGHFNKAFPGFGYEDLPES